MATIPYYGPIITSRETHQLHWSVRARPPDDGTLNYARHSLRILTVWLFTLL